MRRIKLLIILIIFTSNFAFGQSDKRKELKTELIGTWEFVELRDSKGNQIDTIWHDVPGFEKKALEIAKGPLMTFNGNGTYSEQFTPQNTDTGKWYYDKKKKAIIQMLYYSKPYDTSSQYLIDIGHAKQDKNGSYYKVQTEKVVELTAEKLVILEEEDRQRIFKKKL